MAPRSHHILTSRRWFCLGGVAASAVAAGKAVAGGDGGGNKDAKKSKPSKQTSQMAGLEPISQRTFIRMTPEEARRRRDEAKKDGQVLVIDGFREGMTRRLYDMKRTDPRSLRRLMRDLEKLPKRKDRIARIDKEIREQKRRIKVYTENIDSAEGSTDAAERASASDDLIRRTRAAIFEEQLRAWKRRPLEGTY